MTIRFLTCAWALALFVLTAGCDVAPDPQAGDLPAAEMKSHVDDAVLRVAPELVEAFEKKISTAGSHFFQCQMTANQYSYRTTIGMVLPPSADATE